MAEKPIILFIHQVNASFVQEDIRILSKFSNPKLFFFKAVRSGNAIINLLLFIKYFFHQFFWLIWNAQRAKAIYCWFSDYHSFLPAIFARLYDIPLITVLGGYDCNKIKKFNYGIFCSTWRTPLGKYVINNSSLLLPVDKTLIATSDIAQNWPEAHPNGLKNNVKNFSTPWKIVPTGYHPELWKKGAKRRDKTVTTVASCPNLTKVYIKGLDLVIATAKVLTDYQFTVVGIPDHLMKIISDKFSPSNNVLFLPKMPREKLNAVYSNSSVYLQLSRAEGLPNVLCEAMMCGCVPVGSPVFGIPHGIGDAGFVAENPDPKEIAELVRKAHEQAETLRARARERIIENFSLVKREEKLKNIFRDLKVLD